MVAQGEALHVAEEDPIMLGQHLPLLDMSFKVCGAAACWVQLKS